MIDEYMPFKIKHEIPAPLGAKEAEKKASMQNGREKSKGKFIHPDEHKNKFFTVEKQLP